MRNDIVDGNSWIMRLIEGLEGDLEAQYLQITILPGSFGLWLFSL